jgi:hypothetical protein
MMGLGKHYIIPIPPPMPPPGIGGIAGLSFSGISVIRVSVVRSSADMLAAF